MAFYHTASSVFVIKLKSKPAQYRPEQQEAGYPQAAAAEVNPGDEEEGAVKEQHICQCHVVRELAVYHNIRPAQDAKSAGRTQGKPIIQESESRIPGRAGKHADQQHQTEYCQQHYR